MVANRLRDAAAVLEVDSAYRRDAAIMREAADEVDRLRHDIERHVEIACELATECERLRAELASCGRDAERYRWLRDWAGGGTITQLSHIEPDAWDAFVDGEMEETR